MRVKLIFVLLLLVSVVFAQEVELNRENTDTDSLKGTKNFVIEYGLEGKKPIMARVLDVYNLRAESSNESIKTGVIVPIDSIVYLYKYFPEDKS